MVEVDPYEAEEVAREVHREEEVASHLGVEEEVEDSQGVVVVVDSHREAVGVVGEVDSRGDAKCREYMEEIKLWVYGVLECVCRYVLGYCGMRTSVQKMQKCTFFTNLTISCLEDEVESLNWMFLRIRVCFEKSQLRE